MVGCHVIFPSLGVRGLGHRLSLVLYLYSRREGLSLSFLAGAMELEPHIERERERVKDRERERKREKERERERDVYIYICMYVHIDHVYRYREYIVKNVAQAQPFTAAQTSPVSLNSIPSRKRARDPLT